MSSIYKRLFITYVVIIFICVGLVGIIASVSLKKSYQNRIANELKTNALLVRDILSIIPESGDIQKLILELSQQVGARITVVDSEGSVLGDSAELPANMENHRSRPEIESALANQIGQSIRFSQTLKVNFMYIAVPLDKDGKILGIVRLALPLTEIKERLLDIYKIIFFSILIGGLISIALGAWVGRSFSSPLSEMKSFAQKIVHGDFRHKIKINTKDEIGQLADSLNTMSDQLEKRIEAIVEDKDKMEAILSSMKEGVIVFDKSTKITLINSSLMKMLEIRSEKYIGRPYWEVITNTEVNSFLKRALEEKTALSEQIPIIHPIEIRNIQIQTAPITSHNGELLGLVGVFHDLTKLKKFEMARSDFLANVSHELKTPITSIIGFVETLKDGAIDDLKKRDDFLNIIHSQSQRLNNLVNDILSLSRIEFREIEINPEPISIGEILKDAQALYNNKIKLKKQFMKVHVPPDLPEAVSDREMIVQVFSNLIDNAIKFSPVGGNVTVDAFEVDEFIQIDVSDTGIGIEGEHLSRIFERFYRVDKARSREMGGTGLGLAIVKHIVHANKGEVSVKSVIGKGSTFSIFLPKVEFG